jgi:uncharacterized protein
MDPSPRSLALSCCLGIFIAFSPLLGLHTVMIFLLSWLFKLNTSVTFIVAYTINNPWTIIPIIMLEYFLGYFIAHDILNLDLMSYNPLFMDWVNKTLQNYIGTETELCLWCFIIGGTIFSLIASIIAYPVILFLFKRFAKAYENNYSK